MQRRGRGLFGLWDLAVPQIQRRLLTHADFLLECKKVIAINKCIENAKTFVISEAKSI